VRANALPMIPAKENKTRSTNGLGRRSFPRKENMLLRLWMAKTTKKARLAAAALLAEDDDEEEESDEDPDSY
jgi:hypothetical protein